MVLYHICLWNVNIFLVAFFILFNYNVFGMDGVFMDLKLENNEVVPVSKYLGYMFLYMVPVIGFIVMIAKSADNSDPYIRNFSRAYFIWDLITIIIFSCISLFVILNPSLISL